MVNLLLTLREHGIQPTAQRLAVAQFVLETKSHPTADEVWERVRRRSPTLSRATVVHRPSFMTTSSVLLESRRVDAGPRSADGTTRLSGGAYATGDEPVPVLRSNSEEAHPPRERKPAPQAIRARLAAMTAIPEISP